MATDQSAELAASAAHHEIFEYVISTRFPLAKFTGDQLLLKAEAVTLAIVERATRIIKATYGSQAGVTLVYGDDPLWSCLASGVAARMALRHSKESLSPAADSDGILLHSDTRTLISTSLL